MIVDLITNTSGTGLWSEHEATVKIQFLEVIIFSEEDASSLNGEPDDDRFGELRAYFDIKDWNVKKQGLIYTDDEWLDSLRAALVAVIGFSQVAVSDQNLSFSEQGMQSDTFVSMDIEEQFIKEWLRLSVAESAQ